MKDNQAKYPQLRFKGFTDPWKQRKLGEEAQLTMGQSPNSENYTKNPDDYILVQGNADMKNGRVVPRVWTTQITKKAEKSDLILSVRAPVGDIGKTDYDVVLGRGVAAIKGNEFIFQQLGKMKLTGYWTRYSTGSTFESINSNDIKDAKIMVPVEEEQQKIGSFFQQLDHLITLHQRKLAKLKKLKQGYLQKMFPKNGAKVPELRFAGFADTWEQRRLGELGKIYTGNTPKTSDLDNWTDNKEGHIWITPTDIDKLIMLDSDRHLSEQGWSKARKIPENSVLITSIASIGKNTINAVPVAFNQQINAIVPEKNDSYFILSAMIKDTARFASMADQTATAIINKTTFEKFQIATPSYEEQQKIGSFFKQLDATITLHQRKLEKLQELKKGYLQKMFC